MDSRKILVIVLLVFMASTVFFGVSGALAKRNVAKLQQQVKNQQLNTKIIDFIKLFISVVLKNKSEVSFDDRLKLENAVRALNDKAILDQWDKFIASTNEAQAQQEVTNLLNVLVNKISY